MNNKDRQQQKLNRFKKHLEERILEVLHTELDNLKVCEYCGNIYANTHIGRASRYCSDTCRTYAAQQKKRHGRLSRVNNQM